MARSGEPALDERPPVYVCRAIGAASPRFSKSVYAPVERLNAATIGQSLDGSCRVTYSRLGTAKLNCGSACEATMRPPSPLLVACRRDADIVGASNAYGMKYPSTLRT